MIVAQLLNFKQNQEFLEMHGFNKWEIKSANAFGRWLGDTCQETRYNKARRKIGVIGDPDKSQMTREFIRDLRNYHDLKSRFRNATKEWYQTFQ